VRDGYFQRVTDEANVMGNGEYQVGLRSGPDLSGLRPASPSRRGAKRNAGSYSNLAQMSRISFAQGGFFYDEDEDDYQEWLWHMNWRARLQRWRVGERRRRNDRHLQGGNPACGRSGISDRRSTAWWRTDETTTADRCEEAAQRGLFGWLRSTSGAPRRRP
jgi:hypothetical protein